jgi:hypothetical protein
LAITKEYFGIGDEISNLLDHFPLSKRKFLVLGRGISNLLQRGRRSE